MTQRNGIRGGAAFLSWVVVAVAAVLFAGFIYTVFVGSIFLEQ